MLRDGQSDDWIAGNIQGLPAQCTLQTLGASVVRRALGLRKRYGFSYWDSQILAAALEARCDTLLNEDLQSGQQIAGLPVINLKS